ncbi:Non-hem dioxygenase N-terminal domain-containing protein [Hirschfeldia incana]|nr:Non-hem dioxygenase N-terminal domain-containing protein [Hirschfeldia incana]
MDLDSLLPLSESLQLPIIDLSDQNLTPGTSKWDEVKADVRKALEDYGCFQAYVAEVSNIELNKSVFETMEELFDLPVETKQRNVSSKPFHGYLSHNLYQSLGVEEANVAEKVNNFTQLLRPDHGDKSISETIHKFAEQLVELDVMARRMIMESFGVEKYFEEHLNSTYYVFRMMKYTTPPDDNVEETKLGLLSHTDKSIITVLNQYEVEGLEIKTKDEKWIKVKPSQHCFIIMAGDFLCALLNGRLYSPYHRVMMAKKTRYSTAMFSVPNSRVIIDSPEELVDEEHPRVFKPFEYGDFINFFHSEAGRKAESALHAFCAL